MNSFAEHCQRRVLVVEDNRDSAEMLRQLLAHCGYEVMVTHSGQQGLEGARRLQPHAVLCDIGLPDSDGYAVGSVLRQSGQAPRARLIALTGHGAPDDRRRALAAGFDQHLVKPVDTKVLLLEIEAETK
jgi:CheY-like chemotaxis protein